MDATSSWKQLAAKLALGRLDPVSDDRGIYDLDYRQICAHVAAAIEVELSSLRQALSPEAQQQVKRRLPEAAPWLVLVLAGLGKDGILAVDTLRELWERSSSDDKPTGDTDLLRRVSLQVEKGVDGLQTYLGGSLSRFTYALSFLFSMGFTTVIANVSLADDAARVIIVLFLAMICLAYLGVSVMEG
jgi:hypothetical protein